MTQLKGKSVKPCVACGYANNEANLYGTDVLCKCKKCNMVYLNLDWEEEILKSDKGSWWQDNYHGSTEREIEAREQLTIIKKFISEGKLLDYGCGSGNFINLAKEEKFQVSGIEIDQGMANIVKEKLGLDVRCCTLKTIPFEYNSFDVITLWNVLEHCPRPDQVVKKMFELLKTDGYLIIEVPNDNSINKKMVVLLNKLGFKSFLYSIYTKNATVPGSHVSHFTPETLKFLLNKNDLTILKELQRNSPIELVANTLNKDSKVPRLIIKYSLTLLDMIGKHLKARSRIILITQKTKF